MVEDHLSEVRAGRKERAQDPSRYPVLHVCSPGMFYGDMPLAVPKERTPLELVFIPIRPRSFKDSTHYGVPMIEWNLLWEMGQLRSELFDEWRRKYKNVPEWLRRYSNRNIYFVHDLAKNPMETFAPLYCMLPREILERVGLPPTGRRLWPLDTGNDAATQMPSDGYARFERALSLHLWPRLVHGKRWKAFSDDDPVKVLTHSPVFWLPHALETCFERACWYDREYDELTEKRRAQLDEANARPELIAEGVQFVPARYGGPLWEGAEEAEDATQQMIEHADRAGNLRALIDTVASNRVHDDFSPYWSREREDFERAMYHKRAKVKVSFVELPEREAIHSHFTQMAPSPDAGVIEQAMFNDFLALLDQKNRSIVICMRRGMTTASEISRALGYANHTPVTKRLRKIRQVARRYFLEDRAI